MNCQEFERTIIDLGFDHLTEAPTLARALAHAESCARCAARLNRERRMTAGLQAVAVGEATINAPEGVRSALRAAFDEQRAAAAPPAGLLRFARHKPLWGMAAAAMLLLSTVTTALWLRQSRAKVDNAPANVISRPTSQSPPGKSPEVLGDPQWVSGTQSSTVARSDVTRGRRRKPRVKEGADNAGELFPLTFVAKSGSEEFVQTVRIEISRSTLLSMGLPVNIDRGEGLIKADMIIGEDGVARALRIINN
jgi:hypothetical protein